MDITEEIVWEDPPKDAFAPKPGGRLQRLFAELELEPGRWAIVGEYRYKTNAKSMASSIKKKYGAKFQVVSHECKVFARMKPPKAKPNNGEMA